MFDTNPSYDPCRTLKKYQKSKEKISKHATNLKYRYGGLLVYVVKSLRVKKPRGQGETEFDDFVLMSVLINYSVFLCHRIVIKEVDQISRFRLTFGYCADCGSSLEVRHWMTDESNSYLCQGKCKKVMFCLHLLFRAFHKLRKSAGRAIKFILPL